MLQASPLEYFKETYGQADLAFTERFDQIVKENPKATVHQFRYSEGIIRSFFYPAKLKQESLLIMVSGTHGVEGHVGSAVQRWLLDQKFNTKKTALLMVHGINIYGFKNSRRVNESNIDLNRNFIISRSTFKVNDGDYAVLNNFLNPSLPPQTGIINQLMFLGRAVSSIVNYSIDKLRGTVMKGQYSYPKGIFFGGQANEIQSKLVAELVSTFTKPYKKIFIIDLHTGYGERAKLNLYAANSDKKKSDLLLKIFKQDESNYSDRVSFYKAQGDLISYFIDKIKSNSVSEVSGIIFEYGTLDSQTTLGSIESLRRVVAENQNFYFPPDQMTATAINSEFLEMFYPSDPSWRLAIIDQTRQQILKVINYLEN